MSDAKDDPGSSTDLPVSKEELERQKLEIELANYRERLTLEDKKLESDVRDWYYRIATAVATAAIGVSTFFFGQYIQSRHDEANRELEILQDQNTKFSTIVNSLGSSDPAQRAAAANALAVYVDVPYGGAKATSVQISASQEREKLAIQVLANRLIADPEVRNKQEYSRVLSDGIPQSFGFILDELVRVNRVSAFRFARAIGDYSAARLPQASSDAAVTCDAFPSELRAKLDDIRKIVSRIEMPSESVFVDGAPVQAYLRPDALLENGNLREFYLFECNYVYQGRQETRPTDSKKQTVLTQTAGELIARTQDNLAASARNLSASSLTLLTLLRRMKGNLSGKNLEGIVIVNGLLDDLDLSGADLQSSVIAGSAKNFRCEHCNLRYADFRGLQLLPGSSFQGSLTEGLQLSK